jgi:YD repeat-containing protein
VGAPSGDKLIINGEDYSSLSAFKFEGANFYKLKELGDALGFNVAYDTDSRTMIVITKAAVQAPEWRVDEYYEINNQSGNDHSVNTYDENGRPISYWYESDNYTERYDYFYDDLGYRVGESYEYASDYDGVTWEQRRYTTSYYDKWGQLEKEIDVTSSSGQDGDEVVEHTCAYDDDGNLIRQETVTPYNHTVTEYTYDERGFLVRNVSTYSETSIFITEYVRDEAGRVLRTLGLDPDGSIRYSTDYEYGENGLTSKETYVNGDYRTVTTYTYDEMGNVLRRHTDSTDWDSESEYTYDEEGRPTSYTYYDGADLFTTIYTYDAEGRPLRTEYTSPDEDYVIDYTYDAEGRPLSESYAGSDYTSQTDYTYDQAESRRTRTVVITYPPAEELVISDTELTLAVGDEDYLYTYFLPYNCAAETVTWSSSDNSVVEVDGKGNIYARGAGKAVVTAVSSGGLTASCAVTVSAEKFVLHLETTELTLQMGEVRLLRCDAEVVGNWEPYFIRHDGETNSVVALEWLPWEGDSCDLQITPLGVGRCTIRICLGQHTENGDVVFEPIIVTMEVNDNNTAEKP